FLGRSEAVGDRLARSPHVEGLDDEGFQGGDVALANPSLDEYTVIARFGRDDLARPVKRRSYLLAAVGDEKRQLDRRSRDRLAQSIHHLVDAFTGLRRDLHRTRMLASEPGPAATRDQIYLVEDEQPAAGPGAEVSQDRLNRIYLIGQLGGRRVCDVDDDLRVGDLLQRGTE